MFYLFIYIPAGHCLSISARGQNGGGGRGERGEGDSCETKRVSVSPSNSFTILVVLKRVKDLSAYWRIYFSSSGALVIK